MKKGWIQKATASIKRRGTEGVCTGAKFGSSSCPAGSKRYNLAKTFRKMAKNKKEDGGPIQYNIGGDIKAFSSIAKNLGQVSPYIAAAGYATDLALTWAENATSITDRPLQANANPYGLMAMGGKINAEIEGGETISDAERGPSMFIAKGPKHEQGGIPIKANGGVVKSDRIGYDKDGRITLNQKDVKKTFASVDKKMAKELDGRFDPISMKTKQLMLERTEKDNIKATELLERMETYKCGGKMHGCGGRMKKYSPGGILPRPILDAIRKAYQTSNPGYDVLDPYDMGPFGKLLMTNPNSDQSFYTPVDSQDLLGGTPPPAVVIDPKAKKFKKPRTPMSGEDMAEFGTISTGIYSALEGLLSKPEKEKARTITTQFPRNYYNPNEERRANRVALNTALRRSGGSGTANINRLGALSQYMQNEGTIARRKFNYDQGVDRQAATFNLQRDMQNARTLTATDMANAQNRAQTRNLRRQGLGNLGQSIATVGDYKNRQMEENIKLLLLDDLFANYGITATNIEELRQQLITGDYYKKGK